MPDDEYPPGGSPATVQPAPNLTRKGTALSWFKELLAGRASNSNHIQEALQDFIEELRETGSDSDSADSQRVLIENVLKTHDLRVYDIMIPRAEIVAIEQNADHDALRSLFRNHQFSRVPVFDGGLDHVIGILHIKDLLACLLEGRACAIKELMRDVTIVSPGMPVMDLFLELRQDKKHMAMVVDEHGGIDGLVTINDVIEAVMGDIEDEFDIEAQPQVVERADGSILADARMEIEDFEDRYGSFLDAEEREDIETLGGLAIAIAGRVPKRGETLKHSSGLVIEILDANATRVNRIRVRNLSPRVSADEV